MTETATMSRGQLSQGGRLGSSGGRLGSTGKRRGTASQEADSLTIRLCHMKKRADETGYGFNIMSKRDKLCQYVGKVDPGTPAYESGLRTGDKIIEIDNKNVAEMSYVQIIELLRKGRRIGSNMYRPDELLLLVVDQSTDDFFRRAKIPVSSHTSTVPIEYKSSLEQPKSEAVEPQLPPKSQPPPPASPSTSSSISSASEVAISTTPVVSVPKHAQTQTQTTQTYNQPTKVTQMKKSQSDYDTARYLNKSSQYRQSPQPNPQHYHHQQQQQQIKVNTVDPAYRSRCEFAPSWNEPSYGDMRTVSTTASSASPASSRGEQSPNELYHNRSNYQYNYTPYNHLANNNVDESDEVADEISININLNSPGVATRYSNASSSLNSSATTSNDDIEQITFV